MAGVLEPAKGPLQGSRREEGDAAPGPETEEGARRGEAKDSALLSSRDAGLLEPPERPQGQKSPDTPGSPEGNTEGPGTASSEPLLPS